MDDVSSRSCGSSGNRSAGLEVVVTDHCLTISRAHLLSSSRNVTQFRQAINRLQQNGTLNSIAYSGVPRDVSDIGQPVRQVAGLSTVLDGAVGRRRSIGTVVKDPLITTTPQERIAVDTRPGEPEMPEQLRGDSYHVLSIRNEDFFDRSDARSDINTVSEISDIDRDDMDLVSITRSDDVNESGNRSDQLTNKSLGVGTAEYILESSDHERPTSARNFEDTVGQEQSEAVFQLPNPGSGSPIRRASLLWDELHDERMRREEAQFLLDQLQGNYDLLLRKYAEAENTIDCLRFYRDVGGTVTLRRPDVGDCRTPPVAGNGFNWNDLRASNGGNAPRFRSMPVLNFGEDFKPPAVDPRRILITRHDERPNKSSSVDRLTNDFWNAVQLEKKVDDFQQSHSVTLSKPVASTSKLCTNTTKASIESAYMRTECLEEEIQFLSSACKNADLSTGERSELLAQFRSSLSQLRTDCQKFPESSGGRKLAKRLRKLRVCAEALESQSPPIFSPSKTRSLLTPPKLNFSTPTSSDGGKGDRLSSSITGTTQTTDVQFRPIHLPTNQDSASSDTAISHDWLPPPPTPLCRDPSLTELTDALCRMKLDGATDSSDGCSSLKQRSITPPTRDHSHGSERSCAVIRTGCASRPKNVARVESKSRKTAPEVVATPANWILRRRDVSVTSNSQSEDRLRLPETIREPRVPVVMVPQEATIDVSWDKTEGRLAHKKPSRIVVDVRRCRKVRGKTRCDTEDKVAAVTTTNTIFRSTPVDQLVGGSSVSLDQNAAGNCHCEREDNRKFNSRDARKSSKVNGQEPAMDLIRKQPNGLGDKTHQRYHNPSTRNKEVSRLAFLHELDEADLKSYYMQKRSQDMVLLMEQQMERHKS